MTVKEMIEKLKKCPEDMEILNYEYLGVDEVDIQTYERWEDGCEKEFVIII